jgi:hypothetical protein
MAPHETHDMHEAEPLKCVRERLEVWTPMGIVTGWLWF